MKYRRKRCLIDAVQFTGSNYRELDGLVGTPTNWDGDPDQFLVQTPEGERTARVGDWLIRDERGALGVASPVIFEETYEPVP